MYSVCQVFPELFTAAHNRYSIPVTKTFPSNYNSPKYVIARLKDIIIAYFRLVHVQHMITLFELPIVIDVQILTDTNLHRLLLELARPATYAENY